MESNPTEDTNKVLGKRKRGQASGSWLSRVKKLCPKVMQEAATEPES